MAGGPNLAEVVDQVRRLLDEIVQRHPDVKGIVSDIGGLLDGVTAAARTKKPVQRRTGQGVEYHIETAGKRQVLYERRPSGAPLRVSHDLFTVLVGVLAKAERPLPYDEIAERVETLIGTKLADWQGRLLLRFLQTPEPPILTRERSRYQVVDAAKFAAAAQRLWRATERS